MRSYTINELWLPVLKDLQTGCRRRRGLHMRRCDDYDCLSWYKHLSPLDYADRALIRAELVALGLAFR
jgi:hypothetical protein